MKRHKAQVAARISSI